MSTTTKVLLIAGITVAVLAIWDLWLADALLKEDKS